MKANHPNLQPTSNFSMIGNQTELFSFLNSLTQSLSKKLKTSLKVWIPTKPLDQLSSQGGSSSSTNNKYLLFSSNYTTVFFKEWNRFHNN